MSLAPLLLSAALAAAPEPAHAPVAILVFAQGPRADRVEAELKIALAELLWRRAALELAPVQLEDVAKACGSDARCVFERAHAQGASLVLWAAVDLRLSPPLAGISLVGEHAEDDRRAAVAPADPASAARVIVEAAAQLLDEAGYGEAAILTLAVDPSDAIVEIDPAPLKHEGDRWLLRPGSHTAYIHRDGRQSARIDVVLAAGASTLVGAQLAEEPSNVGAWLLGAGIVASVAALVAGIALVSQSGDGCLCVQNGAGVCPSACP